MLEQILNNPDVVIITVGALVGIASSLLGTFLVLRKASMVSDAISHAILLGIILVYLLTKDQYSPFFILGAATAGVLTVLLIEGLVQSRRLKMDSAIGIVYPLLFAIAVVLINLFARNVHIDADAVLLGEIGFVWLDTATFVGIEIPKSLLTMSAVTFINLLFVIFFYKELKLTTFDQGLATALGFSPILLYYLLLSLTSITAVTAFDAVGAVLLVAFIIVPASAAYLLTDKLWRMLIYSIIIAILSAGLGYLSALILGSVSIGGMMALFTGIFLALAFLFSPQYGLIVQNFKQREQKISNAKRMLFVHLYNHEESEQNLEENAISALKTHLRWQPKQIREIMMASLDDGLITQEKRGDTLRLTPKGRILAQEVIEPWRQN